MTIKYEPVVTQSADNQISEQIQQSITYGNLKADDKLPTEEELARQFNVSRPTIREALKRLAAKSLIRSRRGPTGGTFITAPSAEQMSSDQQTSTALMVSLDVFNLSEIAEARHELELICVSLAVERRTKSELDRMEAEIKLKKNMQFIDDEFCFFDIRFYRALVDAIHILVLQYQMFTVIEALQPFENIIIFRFREHRTIIRQHEEILRAIKFQNLDEAKNSVNKQMIYLRKTFARAQKWQYKNHLD